MKEKVALVTGAGSGIGRTTAHKLASNGANVVVADMDLEAAEATVGEIAAAGGAATAQRCDVAQPSDVAALFAYIEDDLGGLDYAVNNAGIAPRATPIADYDLALLRRVMAVNVFGVFNCLQHEVRLMRRKGAGSIVNLSSIYGQVAKPGYAAYAASKHAVEGLTKSVALENAEHGIRVNCVRPAVVQTPLMTAKDLKVTPGTPEWVAYEQANPSKRAAQPGEIAAGILWLLSDEASFVSGGGVNLDGAYLAR
ncbi:SDR family NAD(P)-dependent oxidoreductase [Arthrobacter ginkgonis]